MTDARPDVLVIGGGPGGSSAAARLARNGLDVLVVEKKKFPRAKTCGDGLTPRSTRALRELGLGPQIEQYHPIVGLRACAGPHQLEISWPEHPAFPDLGRVIPRSILDNLIAEQAKTEGATVWEETEALEPVLDRGHIRAVTTKSKDGQERTVAPRLVVVADGSLSRFGRKLGNERRKHLPMGMAIRGYYDATNDRDQYIESHIGIYDRDGNAIPGYGWIFPVGDGTINVGIGLLSTFRAWKGVNTTALMNSFREVLPDYWGADLASERDVKGGKLPMGMSVSPRVGPNWVTIGDAGGVINPFNGEGIAYAMETAEMATDALGAAVKYDDFSRLGGYATRMEAEYADYYRLARQFVRIIGEPRIMKLLTAVGMRSEWLMGGVLRVMSNLIVPGSTDVHHQIYGILERMAVAGPEPQ